MNAFFKRTIKESPPKYPLNYRLYVWRDKNHKIYTKAYAHSACLFALSGYVDQFVINTPEGQPAINPIKLFVFNTDEMIDVEYDPILKRCRLFNDDEARWWGLTDLKKWPIIQA